ncbi:hypothetical protein ZIOFF_037720 [Zingiber officinale]|uniref:Uncharacterized protein n=1 Tax=Zingiber officinale TaxID=94328 RepID=A0A8J5GKG1_ZINOF|nr:hypothetical protein ZIOFF_037720 [Zingiber officinale]
MAAREARSLAVACEPTSGSTAVSEASRPLELRGRHVAACDSLATHDVLGLMDASKASRLRDYTKLSVGFWASVRDGLKRCKDRSGTGIRFRPQSSPARLSEEKSFGSKKDIPFDVKDLVHDLDAQAADWYIAMESLCEILPSLQPIILYFPDCSPWLSRAVPKSNRKEFIKKVEEMLQVIPGPVVFICGQNIMESGSKEKENLVYSSSCAH